MTIKKASEDRRERTYPSDPLPVYLDGEIVGTVVSTSIQTSMHGKHIVNISLEMKSGTPTDVLRSLGIVGHRGLPGLPGLPNLAATPNAKERAAARRAARSKGLDSVALYSKNGRRVRTQVVKALWMELDNE